MGTILHLPDGETSVSEHLPRISDAQLQAPDDAQARFVQENLRRVFLLIYRIVGNVDDAQDLTQETFIKALQRQSQLKDLEKAAHWISRIASNTAIDFLRRNKRFTFTEVNDVPELSGMSSHDNPEQAFLRGERKLQLDGVLATLTERERTALLLRDVEDIPAAEVARQMNCSMATVRSHIANARIKFRRYMEARKP
ncbi:MAG TPA: sigma-70 family RNA polymerase sigma factor [Bryobacteraceae bacterium]|jgi:RNA polymerase sigma-70 factor (ECF subfamily)|nr:sigma-70 family RNA polymerase sigma factor [Bryobacteraceae bacterium]